MRMRCLQTTAALAAVLALSACAGQLKEVGQPPELTPVGAGMAAPVTRIVAPPKPKPQPAEYSLWPAGKDSMFHDQRARNRGDVLTVLIQIDDWAKLDNKSKRSRDADVNGKLGLDFSYDSKFSNSKGKNESGKGAFNTAANGSIGTGSKFSGAGAIARSEKIKLAIAAVITEVLPNGNFVIAGSQEVRVNEELRELRVAGIVRPEDISQENTITYDKIAEARISYGGRGRITEVQQPGVGQQIWDIINPF